MSRCPGSAFHLALPQGVCTNEMLPTRRLWDWLSAAEDFARADTLVVTRSFLTGEAVQHDSGGDPKPPSCQSTGWRPSTTSAGFRLTKIREAPVCTDSSVSEVCAVAFHVTSGGTLDIHQHGRGEQTHSLILFLLNLAIHDVLATVKSSMLP